jgi:tryptophan-rich sensory protein
MKTLEPGPVVGALTTACAVAGSILTNPKSAWYRSLRKPPWQPPPAAFPLVWTTLYAAIGAAATRTITGLEKGGRKSDADRFKAAYVVNLALNAAWSGIFFRAHALRPAVGVAAVLAASAADLARRARPTGRANTTPFLAYAAWCAFATALSAAVVRRNRA